MNSFKNSPAYQPDKMLQFRSMRNHWNTLYEYYGVLQAYMGQGIDEETAQFAAFKQVYLGKAGHACQMTPREWKARSEYGVAIVESMLREYSTGVVPRNYRNRLETHRALKMNYRVGELIKLAMSKPPEECSSIIERRRVIDAARNLMLTFQVMQVEMVDSSPNVGDDLRYIDEMTRETGLFLEGEAREIIVVTINDSNTGYIDANDDVKLFLLEDRDAARAYALKLQDEYPDKCVHMHDPMICRVAQSGTTRWIVNTDSRGKEVKSVLRRLESGRTDKDRRAWRDVVVATEEGTILHVATESDVEAYHQHVMDTLWNDERLTMTESSLNDKSDQKSTRHERFWSLQIDGRIRAMHKLNHAQRVWNSLCEHQITTIRHYLEGKYAHTELNHDYRRAKQIFKTVLPLYWPDHGITWSDPEVREDFEQFWQKRFGVNTPQANLY